MAVFQQDGRAVAFQHEHINHVAGIFQGYFRYDAFEGKTERAFFKYRLKGKTYALATYILVRLVEEKLIRVFQFLKRHFQRKRMVRKHALLNVQPGMLSDFFTVIEFDGCLYLSHTCS